MMAERRGGARRNRWGWLVAEVTDSDGRITRKRDTGDDVYLEDARRKKKEDGQAECRGRRKGRGKEWYEKRLMDDRHGLGEIKE